MDKKNSTTVLKKTRPENSTFRCVLYHDFSFSLNLPYYISLYNLVLTFDRKLFLILTNITSLVILNFLIYYSAYAPIGNMHFILEIVFYLNSKRNLTKFNIV